MIRLGFAIFLFAGAVQAQWQVQVSGTVADLRGIHSLGKGVAWASGSKGTVLRTVDNGTTWQVCAVPPGAEALDFRGVQAFDAQTAIVMSSGKGDLSRLYQTTDGCKSWTLLFTNPDKDGFWDGISLTSGPAGATAGWLLGDPVGHLFTLYRISMTPSDGSHTAHFAAVRDSSESLTADPASAGAFAASNSALLEVQHADKAYIGPPPLSDADYSAHLSWQAQVWFVTGGQSGSSLYKRQPTVVGDMLRPSTWARSALPVGSGTAASGAFSMASNGATVVIVGGDYSSPEATGRTAVYCLQKGSGVCTAAITSPRGYRSAVAYSSAIKTWITVGPNGTDESTDDGRNWRPVRPGPAGAVDEDRRWNALSLPFVVGPHGRIGLLRADALGR